MYRIIIHLVVLIFLIIPLSCNNSVENQDDTQDISQAGQSTEVDTLQTKSFVYLKYKLPLSIDVYQFLKSKKIDFNKTNMHSIDEKDRYFTNLSRALALGIYSSDLAYATLNDKNQEAVDYFSVSIDLVNKLNINKGYDSQALEKIYNNLEHTDSLSQIASKAYFETCTSLEQNNQTNILPFVVLASWIESLHILSQSAIGSAPEDGIFDELYNQQVNLAGMLAYLSDVNISYTGKELNKIRQLEQNLNQLKEDFKSINVVEKQHTGLEQLKDVILKIQVIRGEIINY